MTRDPDLRDQLHDPDFFHEPVRPSTPVVDALTDIAALIGSTIFTVWGIAGWLFVVWLARGLFS